MIIKPYSTLATETFDAADYPALKHFWSAKGGAVAAGGTLPDDVGSADITLTSGATVSGNGLVVPTGSYIPVASLTAPGSSACILIVCADWGATTSGFLYGNQLATGGINVGNGSAGGLIYDGTTTKNTTGTQSASAAFTRVLTLRPAAGVLNEAMMFEVNSSTLDVYTNTADLTAATAITAINTIDTSIKVPTADITLYGAAFFKFTGELPAKEVIQAAAAWLDYQWRNSDNVCMYPGFKGRA